MKRNLLPEIINIVNNLKEYWPLTLRQIYYQLVSKELIDNKQTEYKSLSRLLVKAREKNNLSWECMDDRTRVFINKKTYNSSIEYISNDIELFADSNYFKRNLMQGQNIYLEIWIEKDALSGIFSRITNKFCLPLVVCKGYPSKTFLKNFIDRRNGNYDKDSLILYFGDMDPSGLNIFDTTKKYFNEKVDNFNMKRIALTTNQIKKYKLPHSPEAIKIKDSRTKEYIKKYGKYAVELDSLSPENLINIAENAIKENIDLSIFEEQINKQENDIEYINSVRDKAIYYLENLL